MRFSDCDRVWSLFPAIPTNLPARRWLGTVSYAPLVAALLTAIFVGTFLCGNETAIAQSQPPTVPVAIRYSRIMMPREKIAETRGYLPVKRTAFETLIRSIEEPNGDEILQPRIEQARYQARFTAGSFVDGTATMVAINPNAQAAVLPFSPCTISVRTPQTKSTEVGQPEDQSENQPNDIPIGIGPNGKRIAIVDNGESAVRFGWSLAGHRLAAGQTRFSLALPVCGRNTIELLIPNEYRLTSDHGVVTDEPESIGLSRWSIEAGSTSRLVIDVLPVGNRNHDSNTLTIFRQRDRLEVSPRGIDGTVDLQLEVLGSPQSQCVFALDPSMHIQSIQLGDEPLDWTLSPQENEATVVFPTKLNAGEHRLRITFTAPPLRLNRERRLPRIHPRGIIWQQGSAVVTVSHPLQLADLALTDCRQVASVALTGPSGSSANHTGQQMEFEYHRARPTIAMRVQTQATRIRARTGTLVTIGGGDSHPQALATTRFDSQSGQCFELKAVIPKQWDVQDVTSDPEDAIEEWSVKKPNRPRELVVRLARPLQDAGQLTLRVSFRRVVSGTPNRLRARALRVVRFVGVQSDPQLFAVRGLGATRIQANGGHDVEFLQRGRLKSDEESVLDARRGDLIFRDSPGVANLLIGVTRGFPVWQADIDVATTILSDSVTESFSVQGSTDGATPDRLVLQTWPRREQPIRWTRLASKPERHGEDSADDLENQATGNDTDVVKLNSRRLTEEEARTAGYDSDCDIWDVQLPNVDSGEVRIQGTRRFGLLPGTPSDSAEWVASVASAPNSSKQRATSTLIAAPAVRRLWKIDTALPQVPLPVVPQDKQASAFGSFLVDTASLNQQTIQFRPPSSNTTQPPAVWISHAQTTARLSERSHEPGDAGVTVCTGVYTLENLGADSVSLQFPPDAILRRATLDGQPLLISDGLRGSMLEVTLPMRSRFVELVVVYSLNREPLTPFSHFRWERPKTTAPELDHELRLVLPTHYRPLQGRRLGENTAPSTTQFQEWLRRLFGPLTRNPRHQHITPAATIPTSVANLDLSPRERTWVYPVTSGKLSIRLFHQQTTNALGWGALLIMAFAVRSLRGAATTFLAIAALAATVIGWLDAAWIPTCRGALWGVFLGLAWRTLPRRTSRSRDESVLIFRKGEAAQTVILLACALFLRADTSQGQAAEDTPPGMQAELYRVLFPVDEKGQSNSSFVYVPTKMYDQMVLQAHLRTPASERWIVTSARYAGRLESTEESAPTLNRLDATIQLTTFRPGVPVELNFSTAFATGDSPQTNAANATSPFIEIRDLEQVRLDGQPLDSKLSADGKRLQFNVEQSGNHTLGFSRVLQPKVDDAEWEVDLPLVESADTQLDFSCDHAELQPHLLTDQGPRRPLDGERKTIDLGPIRSASIRWRTAPTQAGEEQTGLRQLSWLTVFPGMTRYDVRFVPMNSNGDTVLSNELDSVRVAFDSRLQLISSTNLGGRVAGSTNGTDNMGTIQTIESNRNRRIVEVRRNARSSGLGLQFILTTGRGIGEVTLPPIEVIGANVESEWIANSIAPSLLFDRLDREALGVSLADFAKSWGIASEVPAFVIRRGPSSNRRTDLENLARGGDANGKPTPWKIKTYPRGSRAIADSQLTVTYDHEQAILHYEANVSTVEGLQFQHRLSAPKKMHITTVAVEVAGNPVPIHWTQANNGDLHIFVFNPTAGAHSLVVEGTVARTDAPLPTPLPLVRLEDCTLTKAEATIRRRTTAHVSIIESTGLQRATPSDAPHENEDSQLVATLVSDGTSPLSATLRIRDNRPTIIGQSLTTLEREVAVWSSRFEYACQFEGGTPDQLRFRIPDGWGESLQLTPSVHWDFVPSAAGELQLVVYPDLADDATEWRLTMQTPLEPSQRAAMPIVLPVGNTETTRWLNLPTEIDGQRVAWDRRDTEPAKRTASFKSSPNTKSFRLLNDQASAELRRIETPSKHPNVLSEQIRVHLTKDGYHGTVTWDIDPGGTRLATLTVPPHCSLVAVTIDDILANLQTVKPMAGRPDDQIDAKQGPDTTFQFDIGGLRLSQQVHAIFISTDAKSPLLVPQLASDRPRERVWHVSSTAQPTGAKTLRFSANAHAMKRGEYLQLVLQSRMNAIQSPDQDAADYSTTELTAWFRRWQKKVLAVSERISPSPRPIIEDANGESNNSAALLTTEDVKRQLRSTTFRLGISEQVATLNAMMNRTSRLLTEKPIPKSETNDSFFRTASDSLSFAKPRINHQIMRRIAFTSIMMAILSAMLRMIALPSWRGIALRWCHALLALVGLAWILCLKWPLIGATLVAAAVWWAIAPGHWTRTIFRNRHTVAR